SIIGEISDTLTQFLQAIHPLIKSGTPLVLTLLAYQHPGMPNKFITLKPLLDQLDELGYEQEEVLPTEISSQLGLTGVDPYQIIYRRPDQIVARAIVKLVKI
ncbi:hypothetical protein IT411_00945, partial [Candidatus Peregrinibacteria bacterium]|nr:hypothetical protein [Candidatus Peregrinibacteria bacterium]